MEHMMTWHQSTKRYGKHSRNFSALKTKTIYKNKIMSEKSYIRTCKNIFLYYYLDLAYNITSRGLDCPNWGSPSMLHVSDDLMVLAHPLNVISYYNKMCICFQNTMI